jgi:hypothetical protein
MTDYLLEKIEQFVQFVPTAAGSDLNKIKPFLEEAGQWLCDELLGDDLYQHIKGLSDTSKALQYARTAVCLRAYETAIPFVDLIQTNNGFAVVSNTSQAPASKERVERLLDFVRRRLTSSLDRLWTLCLEDEELRELWQRAGAIFNRHTEIVFVSTAELRAFSKNQAPVYSDLQDAHPEILLLQAHLANAVSGDYLNELIDKRRNGALTAFDRHVFSALQSITGLQLQQLDAREMTEKLINYMTAHPEEFPAYMNSPEYRLKTAQKYENRKDDTTFFFG